jgi:hypothetical protein
MQTLVIELHSTIKKPNNQTKQSNPTIYDTNSNQIPKNPTPTPSGACPPSTHAPRQTRSRPKVNRPSHSPPEIPAPSAIYAFPAAVGSVGSKGSSNHLHKSEITERNLVRESPRSPNPVAKTSRSPREDVPVTFCLDEWHGWPRDASRPIRSVFL